MRSGGVVEAILGATLAPFADGLGADAKAARQHPGGLLRAGDLGPHRRGGAGTGVDLQHAILRRGTRSAQGGPTRVPRPARPSLPRPWAPPASPAPAAPRSAAAGLARGARPRRGLGYRRSRSLSAPLCSTSQLPQPPAELHFHSNARVPMMFSDQTTSATAARHRVAVEPRSSHLI